MPGRRSPGPQWHKEYTPESKGKPRVLMIDYILKEGSLVEVAR